MRGYGHILAAVAMLMASGCSRQCCVEQQEVEVLNAPRGLVLATVGDAQVTVGDYWARYDLESAIFCYRKGLKPEAAGAKLHNFQRQRVGEILPQVINFKLVNAYLSANQLQLESTNAAQSLEKSLKSFRARKGLEEFAATLGVKADYLRGQLLFPDYVQLAREHFEPECRTVTEAEIDAGLDRLTAYYERAVATNRLTWAKGSNVLERIRGGLDFAAAAAEFGEYEKDEGVEWNWFEPDELAEEDAELRNWAFSAPVGAVDGLFDLGDGLSIVKILEREAGTVTDSVVSEGVAQVHLARITFFMVEEEPEPRTREYVRGALRQWKGDEAQKRLFAQLRTDYPLSFPNGTNFTFQVKTDQVTTERTEP